MVLRREGRRGMAREGRGRGRGGRRGPVLALVQPGRLLLINMCAVLSRSMHKEKTRLLNKTTVCVFLNYTLTL